MAIECFKCRKKFVSNSSNIKIIGPDVEVSCPFCYTTSLHKLNKFATQQIGDHLSLSPTYAAASIKMAQYIELNASDYYKEKGLRHGGKKKVRDLRAGESAA